MTTYSKEWHYEYCMGQAECKHGDHICPHNHFLKNEKCECKPTTSDIRDEIRKCFRDSYMQTEGDTELFDTEETITAIAQLFKSHLDTIAEGLPKKERIDHTMLRPEYTQGYNQALTQVHKLIKAKKEEL